jgi:RsmE family RNA methyltransferase
MGGAKVVGCSGDEVVLEVELGREPPSPPLIDLILALPRPKMLRKVLQAVASLGVKRLVLLNSFRVEKSYFSSPLLSAEKLREELILGLEQGCDTAMPEVMVRNRFKPFVEDELDELWPAPARRLVAHPKDAPALEVRDVGTPEEKTVVAIGPEGGFIPYEVALLEAHGFQRFSLGPRILRVEAAVPFVLGQLELARRARLAAPRS